MQARANRRLLWRARCGAPLQRLHLGREFGSCHPWDASTFAHRRADSIGEVRETQQAAGLGVADPIQMTAAAAHVIIAQSRRVVRSAMTDQESGGWTVSASTATLAELYRLLEGSANPSKRIEIQRELVNRARHQGLSTEEIVKILVANVPTKRARGEIAKQWCAALGLTEKEAKRLAG